MKTYIIKKYKDREPIIAMTCENVEVARRFLKKKLQEHKDANGKNKLEGLFNDGKKLIIGQYIYEAKSRYIKAVNHAED